MTTTIALDGMGGDAAPLIVVAGADLIRVRHRELRFVLFGDETRIGPLLSARRELAAVTRLVHTADFVSGDTKPSIALRQGRNSSMRLAINAVKDGEADAAVSAGNTGALMAMAKFVLKTLPGIDRPAIAGLLPTRRKRCVALDLGANVECSAENLLQFAVMGEVFARALLGVERPEVGLLNVGTEDVKGDDVVRTAAAMLRDSRLPIQFKGFVEGTDVLDGSADVVVTDGFTGNVALKIAEGTAGMYSSFLREAFTSSLRAKLGYLLAKPALDHLRSRVDPRQHNGAMVLGLSGVVVKSHGGTDEVGFANAIGVAADLVSKRANERIIEEIDGLGPIDLSDARAAAT